MHGQRPVPDPGEPVVPVPLAAGLLGQPERGGGDRRAGRLVGEQLERHRRPGDHLPPPAGVGGAAQPALPVRRGVLRQPVEFGGRQRLRLAAHGLQHHAAAALAFPHRERGAQPVAGLLHGRPALSRAALCPRVQRQLHAASGAEDRAAVGYLDRVLGPAVVEPGLDVHLELHGAARHPQVADQPVPVGGLALDDRHEVQHLADPVRRHEPGDQHRGVREVQLLGHVIVGGRRDPEVAALLRVEQRREDARRIEPRAAEEVHRAVGGHQRRRLQVTDEPVITDVRIASVRSLSGHPFSPCVRPCTSVPCSSASHSGRAPSLAHHPGRMMLCSAW